MCDMQKIMNADYDDANGAPAGVRGQEPLFFVSVQLGDENEIPAHEIKEVVIEPFHQKTSKALDFDLLAHLELEPEVVEGEGEESEPPLEEEEEKEAPPIFKKTVPNIEKYWLRMEPSKEEYCESLKNTFNMGLEHIKNFERWSKHYELKPYADALEDWDEKVGDSNWDDQADSVFLDPKTWIHENEVYTT